jgi:Uncharacterized proteins of the AP superfamily
MKIRLLIILLISSLVGFAQNGKTENVFIITLDGLRWQELYSGADSALVGNKEYVSKPEELQKEFWAATPQERRKILLPFTWSTIASEGQLYGSRGHGNKVDCSNKMWFSYPGYNEILTGAADDQRINSNDKVNNPNVTVLEHLNNLPAFKGKVAAFGSWDVFPFIINEERSGIPVNAGYENVSGSSLTEREKLLNELQNALPKIWESVRLDGFTHYLALEYLKKNTPRFIFIGYGETDDFAHDGKYDEYLKSARQTDAFIKELWEWAQSHPQYKGKTTFLITTDHGRGTEPPDTWRSHGSKYKGADQIWFAVMGPDTPAMGEIKEPGQYYQNQLAKTAAAFLGVEFSNDLGEGKEVEAMRKK